MPLQLTLVSDGNVSLVEVAPTATLSTLSLLIHTELQIPPPQQHLTHNNQPLSPTSTATISSLGIANGDLIMVNRKPLTDTPAPSQPPSAQSALSVLRNNPSLMEHLRSASPQLHRQILAGDPAVLQRVQGFLQAAMEMRSASIPPRAAPAPGNPPQPYVDPMSADAQKAIEERIRQQNVMQNMEAAMEHNPESFGSVVMLFVDCKVNSVDGVKAFVDSGAQATIISKDCAERCNILRLLDSRFQGMAHGVGTAKIYGRIHLALLTLGSEIFEVSFTVMDAVGGEYDMLLGLDMLRKHQASIDLEINCLRIGATEVPFLAEKDIPKKMLSENRARMEGSDAATNENEGQGSEAHAVSGGASASGDDKDAVTKLMGLGFSRMEVEEALRASNGNAENAAAILAASKYGF